jgi:hypothetical protein
MQNRDLSKNICLKNLFNGSIDHDVAKQNLTLLVYT